MSLPNSIPTPIPSGDSDRPSDPSPISAYSFTQSTVSPAALAINTIGRYVLHPAIARGGMATVHAARLVAAEGVTRLVAAKRLHPHFTDDPEFVAMFHDEARIASRIHHPNVVPVLDVVHEGEELILVQEYVHGVPLSQLFKLALKEQPIPIPIAITILSGILAGLQAAHDATDELGEPLEIVHRDVSPQNVIVSVDGVPRLLDFGIAKAKTSVHHTREGFFKGKLAYMSPEQLRAEPVTRQVDIYAAGVLLWEALVNRRYYDGKNDADFVRAIALGSMPTVTQALEGERERDGIPMERWADIVALEPIVMCAMSTNPEDRYETAAEMAAALYAAVTPAPANEVAIFVRMLGAEYLEKRQKVLVANEESWRAGRFEVSSSQSGSNTQQHILLEDSSHSVKSSGARMRLAAAAAEARRERPTEPAFNQLGMMMPSSTPPPSPSPSPSPQSQQQIEKRALVPWTVVAGLLVIVGLLTGMVIVRPTLAPQQPTTTSTSGASTIDPTPPTGTEPEITTATAASSPSTTTAAAAAATLARPPPPAVVTVVRFVPTPRAATPTPTPPASPSSEKKSGDCNPPFYFEGTKKIFKPACL